MTRTRRTRTDDEDGDGLCADVDPCPVDFENDADGDGVCEHDDNCREVYNPTQTDHDGDGAGNVCEGALCESAARACNRQHRPRTATAHADRAACNPPKTSGGFLAQAAPRGVASVRARVTSSMAATGRLRRQEAACLGGI